METRKIWKIGGTELDAKALSCITAISSALGISSVCAKLLYLRGYETVESAENFIRKNGLSIYDPFRLHDMKEAAERIIKAVENKEHIAIYGDYDVDGVSATAVLYLYLEELAPDIELGYYIPNRFGEGYGMSSSAIDLLSEKGVNLIVTVDTGITAIEEIKHAAELGIDVVVTDHHECKDELPEACAVVDPHRKDCEYPFKELAGVGVAFKLITAIEMLRLGDKNTAIRNVYEKYADLVTLGTIADVMPVVDENRNIIYFGLLKMRKNPRPGIRALLEKAGTPPAKCGTTSISFGIAPRINAAGRMSHASHALELMLLSDDDDEMTADSLADVLGEYNKARQDEEQHILDQAYAMIDETHDFERDRVIVAAGENWHAGVIGIVASKVVEKYGLPAILITFSDEENNGSSFDVGRGSGRSIEGVNLVEALAASSEYLVKFGGHELAAGLSLTRAEVDNFKRAVNDYVRSIETEGMWVTPVEADCELEASDINKNCAEEISLLEPFGISNPTPVFFMRDVNIVVSKSLKGGKHIKFKLEKDGIVFDAIMFNADYEVFNYSVGEKLDLMFNLDINEYNGYKSVQLIVREIRAAESIKVRLDEEKQRYKEIVDGSKFSPSENVIPNRDEFAAVYKALKFGDDGCVSEKRLRALVGSGINLVKLYVILDVLNETGLCDIDRNIGSNLIKYTVNNVTVKVDLEASPLMIKLKSQQK